LLSIRDGKDAANQDYRETFATVYLLVGIVIVALVVTVPGLIKIFSNKRREQICRFRYRDSSDRRDDWRFNIGLRSDRSVLLFQGHASW
jgi:hypothetical protein